MAYGVKYRLKADSVRWKDEIILDILEDGYGGAVLPRAIGAGGIVLSKESAGKVCGTNLKFTIQADTDFEYITFADMATRQYLVNLYRGGSLIWVGYLIADEYSEALINTPYDVQLTATDGLGLLKTVDYVPETDFSSTVHRVNVIDKILATINLGLPYRIAYGVTITGGTDNIFYKAYFHDDYFAGWNCYEVLEAILPPDATITQHNAQWMVRRGEQDSEATHTIYTPTVPFGNYAVTTGAGETVLSLAPIGTGDVYPIGSATVGMEYAWKSMDFYSELVKRPSFLMNYDFADGMNGWTPSVTGIAATYAADSFDYLGITGIDTAHNTAYISKSNQFDYGQKNVSQQIADFVNADGFALELRYCLRASRLNVTAGTYSTIKGVAVFQVSITDGTDTYYLSQTDGWVDGSTVPALPVIYQEVQSIARGVEFVDLKVYADSPPVSGTVTFRAFQFYTKLLNVTGVLFCVTDVVIRTFAGDEMQDRQYYPVTMRTNGVEEAEVTIMPTDVPDIDNFEHTFYNPQFTVSGAMITSYTSGAATGTYTNLMINSLYWLHATNRQKLMGSWRGDGLHLNAVISSAVTGGRKYTVHSGAWDLLNDRIDADLLEIPGSATGSTWAIPTGTYDSSAEWESGGTRPGSSTTGNGGVISYPNYSGLFLPQATWDTYFEIVNPGTTGEYIRALRDFASTGEITAYNANDTTGASIWDAMPIATTGDLGGVIVDGTTITINEQGVISSAATGGGGATDHGALTGLADDDHPQYYNQARGDARYQPLDADLTAIAAISETAGYLKKTAAETWTLDNSTFLTAITKSMVEAVLTGAITSHTHDYEGSISKFTGYLTWNGTAWAWKNETYALSSHNHDTLYEPKLTKSTGYLRWTGSTWEFKNETYLTAITKALVEAVLTGTITSHNHSGVYEPAITKSLGLLYWNGTAWAFDTNSYALASHNHSGVYQPLDADLTAIAGQTGTGFLKRTGTNTWGMAANGANLDTINQDLATDDDVHFNSVDVEDLEVGEIIDGILQTGYGANLLRYSSEFESALWTKSDCTATDNSVDSPFSGSTVKGCYILMDSSNPLFQQAVGNTSTGNHTFSIWLRSSGGNTAVTLKLYTNTQSHAGISVTATTSWQRFSVTNTLSTAHTTKYVRVEWSTQDLDVWGAQLEIGSTAGRYTHTESLVGGGSGAHIYDNLRVAGNLYASDIRAEGNIVATGEVTAYSDARLKNNIRPTDPALERLNKIEVVDYRMNGDTSGRVRTGVIAQQIISLFPQMVEGSEMDYYSVNYGKLVSVAIKAIQELTEKVERLEKILKENGITHD